MVLVDRLSWKTRKLGRNQKDIKIDEVESGEQTTGTMDKDHTCDRGHEGRLTAAIKVREANCDFAHISDTEDDVVWTQITNNSMIMMPQSRHVLTLDDMHANKQYMNTDHEAHTRLHPCAYIVNVWLWNVHLFKRDGK